MPPDFDAGTGIIDAGADSGASEEVVGLTAPGEGTEGSEASQDGGEGQDGQQVQTDGAVGKTSRAFVENYLKSEDYKRDVIERPELAKAIRLTHHTLSNASQALAPIGGLKAISQIAEVVQEAGGIENIRDLSSEIAEYRQVDDALAKGDPAYIDHIANDMPDVFKGMMPKAIEKWASIDPESYSAMLCSEFAHEFEKTGGPLAMLDKAFTYFDAGQNEKAMPILQALDKWMKSMREFAKGTTPNKPAPGQGSAPKTETSDVESQTGTKVGQSIDTWGNPLIFKEMTRLGLSATNMSPEQKAAITNQVWTIVNKKIGNNPAFMQPFQRALKAGDFAKAERLSKAAIEPEFAKAVQTVRGWYGTPKGAKPGATRPTQQQSGGERTIQFSKFPGADKISLRLTGMNARNHGFKAANEMLMSGKAYDKQGRLVTWPV